MAGLRERTSRYRINFRYHSEHLFLTIGKVSEQEARSRSAYVDDLHCGSGSG
jgi:hypothetical protein